MIARFVPFLRRRFSIDVVTVRQRALPEREHGDGLLPRSGPPRPGPLSLEPPRWSFRMLRFSRPGPRVLGVAVLAVATLLGLASPAPARPAAATPGPAAWT